MKIMKSVIRTLKTRFKGLVKTYRIRLSKLLNDEIKTHKTLNNLSIEDTLLFYVVIDRLASLECAPAGRERVRRKTNKSLK